MSIKHITLLVIFILIPLLSFAEGQAGLEIVFFMIYYFMSFLIVTIVGGVLIHKILRKLGVQIWWIGSIVIAHLFSWGFFALDINQTFVFPMSIGYLIPFILMYVLIPKRKLDK